VNQTEKIIEKMCDDYCMMPEKYSEDALAEICEGCPLNKLLEEKDMIQIKENELYQELELIVDGKKIGEAEVDLKGKMLSRLCIFEPYQDKGYGKRIVNMLIKKYGCDVLWVNADNDRAIHVYEGCGFQISEPTMFKMERKTNEVNR